MANESDGGVASQQAPPGASSDGPGVTRDVLLACWLSDSARDRLAASHSYDIITDVSRAHEAAIVAISTRIPKPRAAAVVAEFRQVTQRPIVAIAHAGGEDIAVQILAAGGTGIVAEGNEEALRGYLSNAPYDEGMVDTYEQSLERQAGGGDSRSDLDRVTGLKGPGALEERLNELAQAGVMPRLAYITLLGLAAVSRRMSIDAGELLRRRIAIQFEEICSEDRAELYLRGDGEYALVARGLTIGDYELIGKKLGFVAASFSPQRSAPLALAMGHAGPESTSDPGMLRELAQRALDLAVSSNGRNQIVSADTLTRILASSTELEAAFETLAFVEDRDVYGPGHGERVASYSASIAAHVGVDGRDLLRLRLAAAFHAIGKAALDSQAYGPPDELSGDMADLYRTHADRGADYLRVSAGADVADMVRHHHEHWDGTGFPAGMEGEDIPLGARIIAVADALDRWSPGAGTPTPEALAKVSGGAGVAFDPELAQAVNDIFGDG